MDPLTIASLAGQGIKGIFGMGQAIAGGVQMARANKELNKAFPKYSRPDEYEKMLSIYQKQAGLGELPGQDRYEAKISESTARGSRAAAKYADSPIAAVAAQGQLYGQQQSAIRDLGLQYAAFQQQSQQNLARGYQMGAEYSDKEWWQNVGYPDQVRRNMAAMKWNAGQQNLWGGLDQAGGAAMGGINTIAGAGGFGQKTAAAGIQTNPLQANADAAIVPNMFNSGQGTMGLTPQGTNVNSYGITDPYNYYNPRIGG